MRTLRMLSMVVCCSGLVGADLFGQASTAAKRPMTFLDSVTLNGIGDTAFSVDGKWMVYTLSKPDWKDGRSFTDIYVVSVDRGLPSARQMTFTKNKNESDPVWSRDGRFFVFLSNRDGNDNQIYMMRPDGGEARKLTEIKDGVSRPAISRDGKWLAFTAGKDETRQVWTIAVADIETASPVQLTRHPTGITSWQFSPDSKRLYYVSPATFDKDDRERKEQKFDVRVRNPEVPPNYLWAFELDTKQAKQLTSGSEYSVSDVRISSDSKWIGLRGNRQERYLRNITDTNTYSDVYLLNADSGQIERLTNNADIGEGLVEFSPDSTMFAFVAPNDFQYSRARKIYVRAVRDAGRSPRKLGGDFDADLSVDFWSRDGKTIYSSSGIRVTQQLLAVSVDTGKVAQVTNENASVSVNREEDSGVIVVNYSDPSAPRDVYVASSVEQLSNRVSWRRLTEANPQVRNFSFGETDAAQWTSKDGTSVEGVLYRPVGYQAGRRYPLIVQIHGGPAGADLLSFDASASVYAGAGFVVLQPNYRGSANYGEEFRTDIAGAGNYFPKGYDDIMTGVDHLIQIGLVDGNSMGVMGWSAGGHWSNWILTHTDRFKAISSGAGVANWLSMYAQTDIHRGRENYFGGSPYDLVEHLWDISPLKYIKNAKTPTLIHVVDGDPRVPRPQSEELHMALKKLGVPTEFFVYPGTTHGIPDLRNRLVKAVSEFRWMEKWIHGRDGWFDWKELLETLKDPTEERNTQTQPGAGDTQGHVAGAVAR